MSENSSGSGLGCIGSIALFILVVGGVIAIWSWGNGADPRQAVAYGFELAAKILGGMWSVCCGCACLAVTGLIGLAIFANSGRYRY